MYKNILIPVAYEPGYDVSREVAIAKTLCAQGGSVTLLHVMDPVPFYALDYMPENWREDLEVAILDDMRSQAAPIEGARVEVDMGTPAHVVLEWIEEHGADCVVMATHRTNRALFGSTASRVATHAPCAVHLIR